MAKSELFWIAITSMCGIWRLVMVGQAVAMIIQALGHGRTGCGHDQTGCVLCRMGWWSEGLWPWSGRLWAMIRQSVGYGRTGHDQTGSGLWSDRQWVGYDQTGSGVRLDELRGVCYDLTGHGRTGGVGEDRSPPTGWGPPPRRRRLGSGQAASQTTRPVCGGPSEASALCIWCPERPTADRPPRTTGQQRKHDHSVRHPQAPHSARTWRAGVCRRRNGWGRRKMLM